MGLRDQINKAVGSAFKAIGDIPHVCQFQSLGAGTSGMDNYDIVSGGPKAAVSTYTLPAVAFVRFKEDDPDADVQVATDMKMIFQRTTLPVLAKTGDTLIDDTGRRWTVKRVTTDPADAATILHVRTT